MFILWPDTRANERVLRVPVEEQKGENGDKHVNFVDEAASRKLIAQQKALMRSESYYRSRWVVYSG